MKRNIGIYNNNWKGGHRRDEYGLVTLHRRRVLEIRIEVLRDLLRPGVTPETMHPDLEQKIADAERQLRELVEAQPFGPQEPPQDYRIFNRKQADGTYPPLSKFFDDAAVKADAGIQIEPHPVDFTEPVNEAEQQAEEIASYEFLADHRRTDCNGEGAQVYMNRRISFCSEARPQIIGGVSSKEWYDDQPEVKF